MCIRLSSNSFSFNHQGRLSRLYLRPNPIHMLVSHRCAPDPPTSSLLSGPVWIEGRCRMPSLCPYTNDHRPSPLLLAQYPSLQPPSRAEDDSVYLLPKA